MTTTGHLLTPTAADVAWGPEAHQRFDYFQNAKREPNGNPVFVYRHGGGWTSRDKRLVGAVGDESNTLVCNLLARSTFDVVSIETRQARWDTPITVAGYGTNEVLTQAVYFPESFQDVKRAIVAVKRYVQANGGHSERMILGGSSAGADMAMWSQLTEPIYSLGGSPTDVRAGARISGAGAGSPALGFDSRVRGVWFHNGQPDWRKIGGVETLNQENDRYMLGMVGIWDTIALGNVPAWLRDAVSPIAYMERGETDWAVPILASYLDSRLSVAGMTWQTGASTLTKAGAFASYTYQSGDQIELTPYGNAAPSSTLGLSDMCWIAKDKILRRPGAFRTYTWTSGDKIGLSGGGGAAADYVVGAKLSDDAIVVTTEYNATDILTNDVAGVWKTIGGLGGRYTITGRTDDTLTLSTSYSLQDISATAINGVIYKAKPYRNAHDSQQASALKAACDAARVPCGAHVYASFTDDEANIVIRWMNQIVSGLIPQPTQVAMVR